MKLYNVFIIAFLALAMNTAKAQQLSLRPLSFLGIATNVGTNYFYNGGGFELSYQHDYWKGRISGGLEYRMINWGNQVGLNIGYNLPFWTKKQWRASVTAHAQIGWALFVQKTLAVWGFEAIPQIEWKSKKAFFVMIGVGLRFSHNPVYEQFGSINATLDIPIKVGIGFRLNNKKKNL